MHSSSIRSWCGSQDGGDPVAEVGDRGVERVDVREQLRDHHAVVLDLEAAGERLAQLRDLLAHPGLGQLGELIWDR